MVAEPVTQATSDVATQTDLGTEAESSDLTEGLALLDEIEGKVTQPDAETEAPSTGTEPDEATTEEAPDADLEELLKAERETAAEKASRETREQIATEQQETERAQRAEAQVRGIQQAFKTRATEIRTETEERVANVQRWGDEQGLSQSQIDAIAGELRYNANRNIQKLEEHHGQISPVTHLAYWDNTDSFARAVLPKAAAEELVGKRGSFTDHTQYLQALDKAIRKDAEEKYEKSPEARKARALAIVKAKRAWEQQNGGVVADRVNPSVARTNGSSSAGVHYSNQREAEKLFIDGKITAAQVRAARDSLPY